MTARTGLATAAWAFAAGSGLHAVDHFRRGQGSITETLWILGSAAIVLQVTIIVLAVTGHRVAPLFAAVGGPALAVGFAAAHWLPEWSSMSDPVWEIESLMAMSVVASAAEIVTAIWVGVVGLGVLLREGPASAVAG